MRFGQANINNVWVCEFTDKYRLGYFQALLVCQANTKLSIFVRANHKKETLISNKCSIIDSAYHFRDLYAEWMGG